MSQPLQPRPAAGALTVLYDGACPVCSLEIARYRRRQASEPTIWVDLSRGQEDALILLGSATETAAILWRAGSNSISAVALHKI